MNEVYFGVSRYLKKKHGNVIRAWLNDIDLDGSMAVQQKELFKACRMAQVKLDVRALWRAMDSDQSGVAGLEEVDAFAAEMLAHFRARAIDKYGSCVDFFIACDVHREGKLRPETFVSSARENGFKNAAFVIEGINYKRNKYIIPGDLEFLDAWNPPVWLLVGPDEQAAEEFKELLLRTYKHFVRAWQRGLDRDSSNRVNW